LSQCPFECQPQALSSNEILWLQWQTTRQANRTDNKGGKYIILLVCLPLSETQKTLIIKRCCLLKWLCSKGMNTLCGSDDVLESMACRRPPRGDATARIRSAAVDRLDRFYYFNNGNRILDDVIVTT